MTDDDLLQTVKSEFADIRLGIPVSDVMARGRELRRGRRLLPAAGAGVGALAVAAGLTLGLGGPGGEPALAAWTVTAQPNHTVTLTIRDRHLSGPDRLHMRRALNAVGVPALVLTKRPVCVYGLTRLKSIPYRPLARSKSTIYRFRLSKIAKGSRVVIVVPKPTFTKLPTRPIRARSALPHRLTSVHQLTKVPTVVVIPAVKACLLKPLRPARP
jgi:hypothetical protein